MTPQANRGWLPWKDRRGGSYLVWLLIGLTWAGSAWVYQYRSRSREWQRKRVALATDQGSLNLRTRQPAE